MIMTVITIFHNHWILYPFFPQLDLNRNDCKSTLDESLCDVKLVWGEKHAFETLGGPDKNFVIGNFAMMHFPLNTMDPRPQNVSHMMWIAEGNLKKKIEIEWKLPKVKYYNQRGAATEPFSMDGPIQLGRVIGGFLKFMTSISTFLIRLLLESYIERQSQFWIPC